MSEPSSTSLEVLPRREAAEVTVATLTALYVALFGPVVGLAWTVGLTLGCAATATFGIALILITESLDARLKKIDMEHS